jgi:hypothetical protein
VPSADFVTPASEPYGQPPPSYDDTFADLPPDYTTTDALATVQTPEYTPFPSLNPSLCSNVPNCLRLSCDTSPTSSLYLDEKLLYADIGFGFSEDGVKSHAKKKKAPAKKAVNSWDEDDNKKKEEEGAGGEGGGDNGGGDPPADGGAGGAGGGDDGNGGNGGVGGGADDWGDAWDTGKKKKKKGKKAQEEEEEAERKRKEEEEEAERKKKEDEEAAAAADAEAAKPAGDLSWADPPEEAANDDWGTFASAGKKKKGKKGKVRPISVA